MEASDGSQLLSQNLGIGHNRPHAVTAYFDDSMVITIEGTDEMTFTVVETVPFTGSLTPGIWKVGIDIPEGRYEVSVEVGVSAQVGVFDPSGERVQTISVGSATGFPTGIIDLTDMGWVQIGNAPSLTVRPL